MKGCRGPDPGTPCKQRLALALCQAKAYLLPGIREFIRVPLSSERLGDLFSLRSGWASNDDFDVQGV